MKNFLNELKNEANWSEQRCVVFAPHPDDEIFGCGGTMALLKAKGVFVQVVVVTDGAGRREDAEATRRARQQESRQAAQELGLVEPIFWDYSDGSLMGNDGLSEKIRLFLIEKQATAVFAPSAFERHPDHHTLSVQVTRAAQQITNELQVAYYEVGEPIFYNTLVDISSVVERKQKAMEKFVSELEFQRYDTQISALNRYRTYTLQDKTAQAAEAFLVASNRELANFQDFVFASDPKHRGELGELMLRSWDLRRQMQNLDEALSIRTQRQNELETLSTEQEKTNNALKLRNENLEHLVEEIYASKSWRVTKPLRQATDWARRVKKSAKLNTLELGLKMYRFGPTGKLITLLPTSLKRKLRHALQQERDQRPIPTFSGKLSDNPLVSIIVPIYNHADYVEAALNSALAQTHANVEVIAINDASPDPRIRQMLEKMRKRDRLTILHNPENLGISKTQNRGLIESKGEIIAFLDCDDIMEPDAIETSLRHWNGDTVYSHSARINIDSAGNEIERICFDHLPRQDYFGENLKAMYATHFKMIRRDVFAKVGLFDPRFDAAQDYDMLMRTAFHYPNNAFAYVPFFVYKHRLHKQQTTEQKNSAQLTAANTIKAEAELRSQIKLGYFNKFISFVMLSFGKHSQTLQAIQSLKSTVHIPHEIVLFDNGSDEETVDFIKTHIDGHFDDVRVFYSPTNLGPAAGRREALKHARGDWFIVFDNDESAEPGWLEEILVRACSDERIGAVCAKVVFPNHRLQFSGGYVEKIDPELVQLQLFDRDKDVYDISTSEFRDCDWCPIGATLFKVSPLALLHGGYPNVFEDAGVSLALKKQGYRLVNSPASWVWHEHMMFQKKIEMGERYIQDRYNPQRMLISIASFYKENGLIIEDEYVWRENGLYKLSRTELKEKLKQVAKDHYPKELID